MSILTVTDVIDVTNDRKKNIRGIDMSRLFDQSPVKYCSQYKLGYLLVICKMNNGIYHLLNFSI